MELSLEPADGLSVHHVTTDAVFVGARELRRSFLLTPERIIDDWACTDAANLSEADVAPILALQPELVVLGSGERQQFPPGEAQAVLLGRGVGLECMNNAAAGRTFNLLASEARRVVAAFILPTHGNT